MLPADIGGGLASQMQQQALMQYLASQGLAASGTPPPMVPVPSARYVMSDVNGNARNSKAGSLMDILAAVDVLEFTDHQTSGKQSTAAASQGQALDPSNPALLLSPLEMVVPRGKRSHRPVPGYGADGCLQVPGSAWIQASQQLLGNDTAAPNKRTRSSRQAADMLVTRDQRPTASKDGPGHNELHKGGGMRRSSHGSSSFQGVDGLGTSSPAGTMQAMGAGAQGLIAGLAPGVGAGTSTSAMAHTSHAGNPLLSHMQQVLMPQQHLQQPQPIFALQQPSMPGHSWAPPASRPAPGPEMEELQTTVASLQHSVAQMQASNAAILPQLLAAAQQSGVQLQLPPVLASLLAHSSATAAANAVATVLGQAGLGHLVPGPSGAPAAAATSMTNTMTAPASGTAFPVGVPAGASQQAVSSMAAPQYPTAASSTCTSTHQALASPAHQPPHPGSLTAAMAATLAAQTPASSTAGMYPTVSTGLQPATGGSGAPATSGTTSLPLAQAHSVNSATQLQLQHLQQQHVAAQNLQQQQYAPSYSQPPADRGPPPRSAPHHRRGTSQGTHSGGNPAPAPRQYHPIIHPAPPPGPRRIPHGYNAQQQQHRNAQQQGTEVEGTGGGAAPGPASRPPLGPGALGRPPLHTGPPSLLAQRAAAAAYAGTLPSGLTPPPPSQPPPPLTAPAPALAPQVVPPHPSSSTFTSLATASTGGMPLPSPSGLPLPSPLSQLPLAFARPPSPATQLLPSSGLPQTPAEMAKEAEVLGTLLKMAATDDIISPAAAGGSSRSPSLHQHSGAIAAALYTTEQQAASVTPATSAVPQAPQFKGEAATDMLNDLGISPDARRPSLARVVETTGPARTHGLSISIPPIPQHLLTGTSLPGGNAAAAAAGPTTDVSSTCVPAPAASASINPAPATAAVAAGAPPSTFYSLPSSSAGPQGPALPSPAPALALVSPACAAAAQQAGLDPALLATLASFSGGAPAAPPAAAASAGCLHLSQPGGAAATAAGGAAHPAASPPAASAAPPATLSPDELPAASTGQQQQQQQQILMTANKSNHNMSGSASALSLMHDTIVTLRLLDSTTNNNNSSARATADLAKMVALQQYAQPQMPVQYTAGN